MKRRWVVHDKETGTVLGVYRTLRRAKWEAHKMNGRQEARIIKGVYTPQDPPWVVLDLRDSEALAAERILGGGQEVYTEQYTGAVTSAGNVYPINGQTSLNV